MEFSEFIEVMAALREKCPWDRKQTHESLRPYLIEEAYEFLEAVEKGDQDAMREELGDVLLQILFHARLAEERGDFDIHDVIDGIGQKMISRHPHVFGDENFETPEEVVDQWEERKKEEGKLRDSILEGVPEAMPALLRAQRLQGRAAKVGFDWERIDHVMDKVEEEFREFREALHQKDLDKVEDELGDILFAMVNVARFAKVNSEDALRRTIAKFIRRFRHIEMTATEQGKGLRDMSLDEMEALWTEAKDTED
ncbi:nucleoside triphosphate pyrophosphohydrolase [Nitrospirota bacterium]